MISVFLLNLAPVKKVFFLFTAILYSTTFLFSQLPAIQWQNTIGGSLVDYPLDGRQTADGGFIIIGNSNSSISGNKSENNLGNSDYWIVKTNAVGALQWENTIGGDDIDAPQSVCQTTDGSYIVAGVSKSGITGDKTEANLGDYDCWIVKLDETGHIQWQNTIGGSDFDAVLSVLPTADGGCLLGASSQSSISGDKTEESRGGIDYWLVKLNTAGNIEWQKTIGGMGNDYLRSVQLTADGGYILAGVSGSGLIGGEKSDSGRGLSDYWIVKLDANRSIEWQKTVGGSEDESVFGLLQTGDGYIVVGTSQSGISGDKTEPTQGNVDYWLVKLKTDGNLQWQRNIGGNAPEDFPSLQPAADGGYLLVGSSESYISGDKTQNNVAYDDYWLLKLDTTGYIQWQTTIGGDGSELYPTIHPTADAGYVVIGASSSGISGNKTQASKGTLDYWIVKLAPGIIPTTETLAAQRGIKIYPNPASGAVFIQTNTPSTVSLRNLIGQTLITQTVNNGDQINLFALPNGIYFLTEMGTGYSHKLLKQH